MFRTIVLKNTRVFSWVMEGEFNPGFRLYSGTMFGGKTAQLIFDLQRADFAGKKVQAFKVAWDNRYEDGYVTANNGELKFPAKSVANVSQLEKILEPDTEIIGIDEGQFFDERLYDFIRENRERILLIGTILQNTYRGAEPFPLRGSPTDKEVDSEIYHSGDIMSLATKIIQKWPVCTYENGDICGKVAYYPQRWDENGKLSKYSDKTVVIGSDDKYAPRCFEHFIQPTD